MLVVLSVVLRVFFSELTIFSFLLVSLVGLDICFFILALASTKSDGYKHCLACDDLVYDTWQHCLICHKCQGPNKEHTRYGCLDKTWFYRHNMLAILILLVQQERFVLHLVPLDCFLLVDYLFLSKLLKWPPWKSSSSQVSSSTTMTSPSSV